MRFLGRKAARKLINNGKDERYVAIGRYRVGFVLPTNPPYSRTGPIEPSDAASKRSLPTSRLPVTQAIRKAGDCTKPNVP
jgi:hypothetical protein